MHSAVYEGKVRHRRFAPRRHEFTYGVYMVFLDLAELPGALDGHPLWSARRPALSWFRRADYLGDAATPLDGAVRDLVAGRTGRRPGGPVRLLTNLRTFGYLQNPVSFYYCYDAGGERVETVVAEITNTPWGERHAYVLTGRTDGNGDRRMRWRFAKAFHVSPFFDMDYEYDWRFTEPGETLAVHMENLRRGAREFDATLTLHRREIDRWTLSRLLVRYPLMTARVVTAIYWQALRLARKRCPFFPHPRGPAKGGSPPC